MAETLSHGQFETGGEDEEMMVATERPGRVLRVAGDVLNRVQNDQVPSQLQNQPGSGDPALNAGDILHRDQA